MSDAPYSKKGKKLKKPHGSKDDDGLVTGEWSVGICGCCTHIVPNCCMVTCLPFITIAQLSHRLGIARFAYVLVSFLALYIIEIIFLAVAVAAFLKHYRETDEFAMTWDDDSAPMNQLSTGLVSGSIANAVSGAVSLIYFLVVWNLRSKVRERFFIPGGCLEDCCCVLCCSCCALAQMATHTKSYKPGSCDFGPPDVLPPYDLGTPKE